MFIWNNGLAFIVLSRIFQTNKLWHFRISCFSGLFSAECNASSSIFVCSNVCKLEGDLWWRCSFDYIDSLQKKINITFGFSAKLQPASYACTIVVMKSEYIFIKVIKSIVFAFFDIWISMCDFSFVSNIIILGHPIHLVSFLPFFNQGCWSTRLVKCLSCWCWAHKQKKAWRSGLSLYNRISASLFPLICTPIMFAQLDEWFFLKTLVH